MDPTLQPSPHGKPRSRLLTHLLALLAGPKGTPKNLAGDMLAVERTRLAYERTMMAWIRTGLSLISFGFTIYKFFQIQELRSPFRDGLVGARGFGAVMLLTGLCAVFLAMLQHRREMQSLRAAGIHVPFSLPAVVGALVALLGIAGLFAVAFNR